MSDNTFHVLGATGLVGRAIVERLDEQAGFEGSVRLYAQSGHEDTLLFHGRPLPVDAVEECLPVAGDTVFVCLPPSLSAALMPRLRAVSGVLIRDLSSVLPSSALFATQYAAENATDWHRIVRPEAWMLSQLLQPLREQLGGAVVVTLLLPVSVLGQAGVHELARQVGEMLNGRGLEPKLLPVQMGFNPVAGLSSEALSSADLLPETGGWPLSAIQAELAVLLPEASLRLHPVLVPAFYGVGMQVDVLLAEGAGVQAEALIDVWERSGVEVWPQEDWPAPTAVSEVSGSDAIHVGQLRFSGQGLSFWAVADTVRLASCLAVALP